MKRRQSVGDLGAYIHCRCQKQYCSVENLFLSTYNPTRTFPITPKNHVSTTLHLVLVCLYVHVYKRTEQAGPLISWRIQFRTLDTYITYYIHELGCTRITIIHHTRAVLNRTTTDARSTVVSRLTLCRCSSSNIIMHSRIIVPRELVSRRRRRIADVDGVCDTRTSGTF